MKFLSFTFIFKHLNMYLFDCQMQIIISEK